MNYFFCDAGYPVQRPELVGSRACASGWRSKHAHIPVSLPIFRQVINSSQSNQSFGIVKSSSTLVQLDMVISSSFAGFNESLSLGISEFPDPPMSRGSVELGRVSGKSLHFVGSGHRIGALHGRVQVGVGTAGTPTELAGFAAGSTPAAASTLPISASPCRARPSAALPRFDLERELSGRTDAALCSQRAAEHGRTLRQRLRPPGDPRQRDRARSSRR